MERGDIKKGFKAFRNNVKDDNRKIQSLRNCKSCKYLYKDDDVATEEVCHNNSVTSYDIVEDGNTKYCTFWTPVWHKD